MNNYTFNHCNPVWVFLCKGIFGQPFHFLTGEKLELFLRSLNSSKPLYLGQTGLGMAEELGRLALEPGENFCMGGPGMIFSREVLRRMVPHIGTCLREMYTTHEDVEVGRCVRRFGGTQCVWSYEVCFGIGHRCILLIQRLVKLLTLSKSGPSINKFYWLCIR